VEVAVVARLDDLEAPVTVPVGEDDSAPHLTAPGRPAPPLGVAPSPPVRKMTVALASRPPAKDPNPHRNIAAADSLRRAHRACRAGCDGRAFDDVVHGGCMLGSSRWRTNRVGDGRRSCLVSSYWRCCSSARRRCVPQRTTAAAPSSAAAVTASGTGGSWCASAEECAGASATAAGRRSAGVGCDRAASGT